MVWRLDGGTGCRILLAGIASAAMTIPFLMMVVTAFWRAAGYRAGINPEITRAVSDLGCIGSFIWFYTALITMSGGGWLMLRFRALPTAFDRWVGWVGIVGGAIQLPEVGSQFVYSGAVSLNGVRGWYVPLGGWFVWMMVLSPVMYQMSRARYTRRLPALVSAAGVELIGPRPQRLDRANHRPGPARDLLRLPDRAVPLALGGCPAAGAEVAWSFSSGRVVAGARVGPVSICLVERARRTRSA